MPLDFDKLNDPAWIAEQQAKREAEYRAIEAEDQAIRAQLDTALDYYDSLTEKEASFIRSCRTTISRRCSLSDAQKKWLKDIAARF